MTIATRKVCKNCGGTLFVRDENDGDYCLLCCHPYISYRDYGRIGGLQTLMRYGKAHYSEIGKLGGRSRLRRLPAPEAESNRNGGKRSLNRLGELRGLCKTKYNRGEQS